MWTVPGNASERRDTIAGSTLIFMAGKKEGERRAILYFGKSRSTKKKGSSGVGG